MNNVTPNSECFHLRNPNKLKNLITYHSQDRKSKFIIFESHDCTMKPVGAVMNQNNTIFWVVVSVRSMWKNKEGGRIGSGMN